MPFIYILYHRQKKRLPVSPTYEFKKIIQKPNEMPPKGCKYPNLVVLKIFLVFFVN